MKRLTPEEWIKKAEACKKSGEKRLAAACYLRAFRLRIYDESDIESANEALREALHVLEPQEISETMVAKRYLLTFFTGKTPDPVDEKQIFRSERYFYLVLWRYCFENNPEPGIALFRERWREKRKELIETKKVYLLHAFYLYAVLLSQRGEYERGMHLIKHMVDAFSARSDLMSRQLTAQCYTIMANYYVLKNQSTIAEDLYRKAYDLAAPLGLNLYTANIYYEAASFYSTVYGVSGFLDLTEKVLEVTKAVSASPLALHALYRIGYNSLYSGDLKEFWSYVEQLKHHSRRYQRPDFLAKAYLLEGVFYLYNKQFGKAETIFRKGFQCAKSPQTLNLLQRCRILNFMMLGKRHSAFEQVQKSFFDKEEYGFHSFLDLIEAQTPEEIADAFHHFDAHSPRWREESALIFYEKIAPVDPSGFVRFCQKMVTDFSRSKDRLPLTLVYEALGKFYRVIGYEEQARFFLEKAVTNYRRLGMNHAASVLSPTSDLRALSVKRFEQKVRRLVQQSPDRQLKRDFSAYREQNDQAIDELGVYRMTFDFLRGIDCHCDVGQLLDQILRYLCDTLRAQNGFIGLFDQNRALNSSSYRTQRDSAPFPTERWADERFLPPYLPGHIWKTMYLEQGQRMVISLTFDSPLKARYERLLAFFLDEVKPIFGLLVRSTLTFGKSLIDSLTQLNNRWFMEQRLQEEFEKSIRYRFPLSFVMADLDDFKRINDTFGHRIGDEALRIIGARFRQNIRKYDIAARYGGDEFSIILPNTEPERAYIVAEKIRKSVEEITDMPFRLTISFGVAGTGRICFASAEELVAAADGSLYEAKAQKKNRTVVYDPTARNA